MIYRTSPPYFLESSSSFNVDPIVKEVMNGHINSKKNTQQRKTITATTGRNVVSFDESANTSYEINPISEQYKADVWYSIRDMEGTRYEALKQAKKITRVAERQGKKPKASSYRGLEDIVNGIKRQSNYRRSLDAVFDEQFRQRMAGESNTDRISEVYRLLGCSIACQHEANKKGINDKKLLSDCGNVSKKINRKKTIKSESSSTSSKSASSSKRINYIFSKKSKKSSWFSF